MTYEQWEATVPQQLSADVLWKQKAYRLALFASDLAWEDAGKLLRERRTISIADQLYRATGNISSNIAEGYSRGTGKDLRDFMNMLWVPHEKPETGIIRPDVS